MVAIFDVRHSMDNIITAIIAILKDAQAAHPTELIAGIKEIYYGDPVLVPESELPVLIIDPKSSSTTTRGTEYDTTDATIAIKLVQSIKATINPSKDGKIAMAKYAVGLFTEREDTKNAYAPYSVIGILKNNHNLAHPSVNSGK